MKQYAKSIPVSHTAAAAAPVYFDLFKEVEPVIDSTVAFVYDHQGRYLGWSNPEPVRKYLYGKLYYRTKRAYRVTSNRRRYGVDRKYVILTRDSGLTALVIHQRKVTADILVDLDCVSSVTDAALKAVQDFKPTYWSFCNYPDQYKLLEPAKFNTKFQNEFNEMVARQKQEVIEYLNNNLEVHNGLTTLSQIRVGLKPQPTAA